jgi:hypothetical protein
MKQTLIKLSEKHYIIVLLKENEEFNENDTDSEIKEGEKFYSYLLDGDNKPVYGIYTCLKNYKSKFDNHITSIETGRNEDDTRHFIFYTDICKKITHSTQPLNQQCQNVCSGFCINCPDTSVKRLELSEVEELISGYSVEKMAEKEFPLLDESWCRTGTTHEENLQLLGHRRTYIKGFNTHKELVKDKLFTVDDMKKALELGLTLIDGNVYNEEHFQKFIQSLLSPTEWEVTFNEQGKLKLI